MPSGIRSHPVPATVKFSGNVYQVTSIVANAFQNCSKLKKITIGKNVISIGRNAFKNLKDVSHLKK